MALTVTTDLTVITTAETITGWSAIGAQSPALEPDFWVQGTSATTGNCISRAVSGNGTDKGMAFDNGAGIDFTTGTHKDKLVYIWMRCNTPQLAQTRANGGLKVRLCTGSATTNFREWYVDGSDTLPAPDGWICYVIDPQSAGSSTTGTYNANSVRYFGGSMITTTTAKGQNFGIDQISYGRGEVYVSGTVTTAGQGFTEVAAVAYDTAATNRWGIVTVKDGIIFVKGKIIIGHATANTDFSSRNETVVWQTPDWRNASGTIVKQIPDASVGATAGADGLTTYNGLAVRGGTGTTTVSLGVIVGTDGGRSGSTLQCPENVRLTSPGRTSAGVTVSDDTMSLSLYNCGFVGFEQGMDLHGTGLTGDDCFATGFNGCGRLRSNMELRNCTVLNSVAAVTDGAYLWESTTDLTDCLFVNNSRAIVFESTSGTPFTFTDITFGGNTFDVRNESGGAITINVVGGDTPSVEDSGGGSATTLVINPVTLTLTVTDITSGSPIENARVLMPVATGGALPFQASVTIARTGATATVTHTSHGLANGNKVLVKGSAQQEYNGVHAISNVTTNTYDYTVTGTPTTPATGTIVSTVVIIDGTTNGSGIISDTRSYSGNQPISGRVRRATFGTTTGSALGALEFNANADILGTPDGTTVADPNYFSTCMWFYRPTGTNDAIFFENDTNGAGMAAYLSAGALELVDTHGFGTLVAGPSLTVDKWYFVGIKRNGTALTLYVGTETESESMSVYTGTDALLGTSNWSLYYGIGPAGLMGSAYRCSHARCWDAQISEAEFDDERLSGTPVRTTNLVGDWYLDTPADPGADTSPANNDLTPGAGPWGSVTGPAIETTVPNTLYRTQPVVGTINSTSGLDVTVQLIRDE